MIFAGIDIGGGGIRAQIEFEGTATQFNDGSAVPRVNGTVDVARLVPRIVAALNAPSARGDRPVRRGGDRHDRRPGPRRCPG